MYHDMDFNINKSDQAMGAFGSGFAGGKPELKNQDPVLLS
jgi:hypothetical protein